MLISGMRRHCSISPIDEAKRLLAACRYEQPLHQPCRGSSPTWLSARPSSCRVAALGREHPTVIGPATRSQQNTAKKFCARHDQKCRFMRRERRGRKSLWDQVTGTARTIPGSKVLRRAPSQAAMEPVTTGMDKQRVYRDATTSYPGSLL